MESEIKQDPRKIDSPKNHDDHENQCASLRFMRPLPFGKYRVIYAGSNGIKPFKEDFEITEQQFVYPIEVQVSDEAYVVLKLEGDCTDVNYSFGLVPKENYNENFPPMPVEMVMGADLPHSMFSIWTCMVVPGEYFVMFNDGYRTTRKELGNKLMPGENLLAPGSNMDAIPVPDQKTYDTENTSFINRTQHRSYDGSEKDTKNARINSAKPGSKKGFSHNEIQYTHEDDRGHSMRKIVEEGEDVKDMQIVSTDSKHKEPEVHKKKPVEKEKEVQSKSSPHDQVSNKSSTKQLDKYSDPEVQDPNIDSSMDADDLHISMRFDRDIIQLCASYFDAKLDDEFKSGNKVVLGNTLSYDEGSLVQELKFKN